VTKPNRRILVIRLGALGDFVMSFGPFQAIRRVHARDHIVLLTTRPFAALAERSGWFDEIWLDERPSAFQFGLWLSLRRRLKAGRFDRVYDLQTSDRSSFYFQLMRPGVPEWSGIAAGCSHPHRGERRNLLHTRDRQAEQLALAGIEQIEAPDLAWLTADVVSFDLPPRYALLFPGSAPHRVEKRWPSKSFAALAQDLVEHGVTPVLLGTEQDRAMIEEIKQLWPTIIDLCGRTDLFQLGELARHAAATIGSDTGPVHLAAAVGCPTVMLVSSASPGSLREAGASEATVLSRERLADLSVAEVAANLSLG